MTDTERGDPPTAPSSAPSRAQGDDIRSLAESALQILARNRSGAGGADGAQTVAAFCDTLVADAEEPHRGFVARLVARGVTSEAIHEELVPAAARLLGERWVRDELGFVAVTTGAARLQALVRATSASYVASGQADPLGRSLLMVVPRFEDHSLGAFTAADRFRRLGMWVHMAVGLTDAELAEEMRRQPFSMIGLSVGSARRIEEVGGLVERLRADGAANIPVVLGGALAGADGRGLAARTGADLVAVEPQQVLDLCAPGDVTSLETPGRAD